MSTTRACAARRAIREIEGRDQRLEDRVQVLLGTRD